MIFASILRARGLGLSANCATTWLTPLSCRTVAVTPEDENQAPDHASLLISYQRQLQLGTLLPDATQAAAVQALQLLQDAVIQRETAHRAATEASPRPPQDPDPALVPAPAPALEPGSSQAAPGPVPSVRGAYLWGPVGSGKTAIMDLFAATTRHRLRLLGPRPPQPLEAAAAAALQARPPQAALPSPAPQAPEAPAARLRPVLLPRAATRLHFHEFMQSVHGRLHELQLARPRVVVRSRQGMPVYRHAEPEEDPLVTVARDWGNRAAVLCLDELHVTDVADAMILARLFGSLLGDLGTAVVFTSNRPPRDLYKGGLSRKYFEPFVRLVDEHMIVLRMAVEVDYRRAAVNRPPPPEGAVQRGGHEGSEFAGGAPEFAPLSQGGPATPPALRPGRWMVGSGAREQLRSLWEQQQQPRHRKQQETAATPFNRNSTSGSGGTAVGGGSAGSAEVPLAYGRTLKVPCASGDAAWFTFQQLCGSLGLRAAVDDGGALAAPDFLALCRRFREFYVTGVPQLGLTQRDEARRLITLLDVAYDNRCRLVVAAEVTPDALFAPLLEEARRQGVNPRLGLLKSSPVTAEAGVGGGAATTTAGAAAASAPQVPAIGDAAAPAFLPAASVTAALHMRLGPSVTHGSAATNTIHPSEFTGSSGSAAAAPFALPPPQREQQQQLTAQLQLEQQQSIQQQPRHQQQQQTQTAAAALTTRPAGDLSVPRALLAEEVLMYHRAASRLAEMCELVAAEEDTSSSSSSSRTALGPQQQCRLQKR